jgi:hypothetical protein
MTMSNKVSVQEELLAAARKALDCLTGECPADAERADPHGDCLRPNAIRVSHALACKRVSLLALPGFGRNSLKDLESVLERFGLSLAE